MTAKFFSLKTTLPGLFALAVLTSSVCAEPQVLNRMRAVVNGEPVTQLEVDAAVETQVRVYVMERKGMVTKSQLEKEVKKMEERALDDLIDRKLILSEFKSLGGEIKEQFIDDAVNRFVNGRFKGDKDEFLAELKKSGMTIKQFREIQKDQIAIQALRAQNVGENKIPPTPWDKKRKFEEIKGEFKSAGQPKVRIMSIPKQTGDSSMEKQKALVEKIRAQIRSGVDFGSLAKQYSDDSYSSKGGYVGVLDRSTLNKGLTQVAYSLPSGGVSQPLDDGTHWRIMKVDGMVGQKTPSYDELEEEIEKRLMMEKSQDKLDDWLKKLRRNANVKIYE